MNVQDRRAPVLDTTSRRTVVHDALPIEIAFLARTDIDRHALAAAANTARDLGVCAADALIASGAVSATTFYRALARHLDLPFVEDWPKIVPIPDITMAHRAERVALAHARPARWLVAPRDHGIRSLLRQSASRREASDLAITTPAHLAAIIHVHSQPLIEQVACHALSDAEPRFSAKGALDEKMALAAAAALLALAIGLLLMPRLIGVLTGLVFLAGTSFRLIVSGAALDEPVALRKPLADADLPFYTVLVPLHSEADVLPDLLAALDAIDYPRAKLEVLVLIEPEDGPTREALPNADLPPWLHVVFGPCGGSLRTKPRALNIGLLMARGDLLTIFDAEDRPDPNQLRKAAAVFAQSPDSVACLQAHLAIDNGSRSVLARLFALEYAALFDVLNVGLGNLRLPIALGGTSSHFKTIVLRQAGGWDAWNVTEDADLGLRLARLGFDVACLPSTTLEEAPERLRIWMNQRRRWTKGWMQTCLVLVRDAPSVARQLGWIRSGALVLLLTNLVAGPLLFPIFSIYTVCRFARHGIPTPASTLEIVEATLEACVTMLGLISVLCCGYAGLRARRLKAFLPSLPLLLPYQLMISVAAWMGLLDLIRRPHHWHKTPHPARGPGTL